MARKVIVSLGSFVDIRTCVVLANSCDGVVLTGDRTPFAECEGHVVGTWQCNGWEGILWGKCLVVLNRH